MGKGGRGSASEATADDEFFVHIHGKKIDCRKWSRSHPGGSKALRIFKDRDATEQFDMCAASDRSNRRTSLHSVSISPAMERGSSAHTSPTPRRYRYHSPAAVKKLELMSKNAPDAPAERGVSTSVIGVAFEALRQRLVAEGCFEPNYPDEAFKLVLTLGPGFLGARLLHSGMPALGTLLISFSLYLCGWTAHDYLHHGVLKGSSKRMVHPHPHPHPHPNPNPNPNPHPHPHPHAHPHPRCTGTTPLAMPSACGRATRSAGGVRGTTRTTS